MGSGDGGRKGIEVRDNSFEKFSYKGMERNNSNGRRGKEKAFSRCEKINIYVCASGTCLVKREADAEGGNGGLALGAAASWGSQLLLLLGNLSLTLPLPD